MEGNILERIRSVSGKVGFYYKNLVTGDAMEFRKDIPLQAASIIKIPVLVEAFMQLESGRINRNEVFTVREKDKLPSCGALTYMHSGLKVTLEDLYTLMIILSDNTATNLLIDYLGMDHINRTLTKLGLTHTRINRLLFDAGQSAGGIENYITAGEIGLLLEKLYHGEVISAQASTGMLGILKKQRLNGKIPFKLPKNIEVAHKTGEDSGITHDVGIVYAKQPFIVCFCGNEVDVPAYERLMQDVTAELLAFRQPD